MTQEDKDLLLKDISARLPYHPIIYGKVGYAINEGHLGSVYTSGCTIMTKGGSVLHYFLHELKPYLRSMSSMTDEEKNIYQLKQTVIFDFKDKKRYFDNHYSLDYLNSIHVDYRGLIDKGLALEAPDGMYN
jgi:hypothetical protein